MSPLLESSMETHLPGQACSHPTAYNDPSPASCIADLTRMAFFLGQGDVSDQIKGWDMLRYPLIYSM